MDGDGGAVPHIVIAPDGLEEVLLGEDDVGILRQEFEEHKLPIGHFELAAGLVDLQAAGEDLEVPYSECVIVRLFRGSAGETGIAVEMGLHPGYQLGGVEGLCDVVVRPQAQPPDLVH